MYLKQFKVLCVVMLLALVGCDSSTGTESNNARANNVNNSNNTNNTNNGVFQEQVVASSTPRVKFKGGERWVTQLARGLGFERDEVCKEFGEYDCVSVVHFVALGGVEPYKLRIDEPLPTPPLTAPIAVERVALSACSLRAETDLAAAAEARVVFKELSDTPDADALRTMGNRLYQNLLSRDAEADELAEFEGFWTELEEANTENLAEEWATMSCFAVATSTESLFY